MFLTCKFGDQPANFRAMYVAAGGSRPLDAEPSLDTALEVGGCMHTVRPMRSQVLELRVP